MAEDWRQDPFVDPDDPAARERAERRAEREAKRAAKEAKRQQKEAAKQPPPEPPPAAEPPKAPRTPEQEFWDEDPEPAPEAAAESKKPEPAPGPAAESKKPEPVPLAKPEQNQKDEQPKKVPPQKREKGAADPVPAAATAAAAGAAADPVPTPPPEPAVEQAWEKEPPSTPDDDIWGEEGDPDKARAAGAGRGGDGSGGGRRGAGAPKRKYHPFRIAGVIVLFLIFWFVYALFQPFHSGSSDEKVQLKVPKGASVSEVGDLLLEKGVIEDPILPVSGSTLFQMRVTLAGKRSELYAGSFSLTKDMSYGDAIDALSEPPAKRTLTVTIPEGYTRGQAAQVVEEAGVPGSYTKKTVKSKFLDPADYGGKNAESLEGFLFPNTFEMKPKAPVADLVELQLKDFKRQIKKVDMKYAKSKNLTVFDVLIIASMIEDEAGVPKQRKQVAAVIYNRLSDGMPLGIDATIRFYNKNYTEPLTESELNEDSPYNTRENTGLPPGPINSPGIAAIQAAAHPAKSDYIFYVNKPNTCGELAFSTTEEEFEADVAAYEKAREENGGNEPSSC
jgi:uncharacterized YceG family protein